MGQKDQGLGENTLRWGNTSWGNGDIGSLKLISPKNSKIPWRNQGITKGGLEVALTVVLECVCERERSEKNREGVRSVLGL
jgi:hypothetical protein